MFPLTLAQLLLFRKEGMINVYYLLIGILLGILKAGYVFSAEDLGQSPSKMEVLLPNDFEDEFLSPADRFFKYQAGVSSCNLYPVVDVNPKEIPPQVCFDADFSSNRSTVSEERTKTCTIHRYRPGLESKEELVYIIKQYQNIIAFFRSSAPSEIIAKITGGLYIPAAGAGLDNAAIEHLFQYDSQTVSIRYPQQNGQGPVDLSISPPLFTAPFATMLSIPRGYSVNFGVTKIVGFPGPDYLIRTAFDDQVVGKYIPSERYLANYRTGFKIVKIEGNCEPLVKSYLYLMYLTQDLIDNNITDQKIVPLIFPKLPRDVVH